MDRRFKNRLIVGAVGAFLLTGVIVHGHYSFLAVSLFFSFVMLKEFFAMMTNLGARPMPWLGFGGTVLYFAIPTVQHLAPDWGWRTGELFGMVTALVILGALGGQMRLVYRGKEEGSVRDIGATVFATFYVGGMFSFVMHIHYLLPQVFPDAFRGPAAMGPLLMLLPFCGAWGSDSGAYMGGRFFGHQLFSPRLSPKKTWEGALAGLISGGLCCTVVGWFVKGGWPLYHYMVLGVLLSMMGLFGDLGMSAIKRESGVKDAGTMLGSHGGVLDRSDSLLLTTPATYLYLMIYGNLTGVLASGAGR